MLISKNNVNHFSWIFTPNRSSYEADIITHLTDKDTEVQHVKGNPRFSQLVREELHLELRFPTYQIPKPISLMTAECFYS